MAVDPRTGSSWDGVIRHRLARLTEGRRKTERRKQVPGWEHVSSRHQYTASSTARFEEGQVKLPIEPEYSTS